MPLSHLFIKKSSEPQLDMALSQWGTLITAYLLLCLDPAVRASKGCHCGLAAGQNPNLDFHHGSFLPPPGPAPGSADFKLRPEYQTGHGWGVGRQRRTQEFSQTFPGLYESRYHRSEWHGGGDRVGTGWAQGGDRVDTG